MVRHRRSKWICPLEQIPEDCELIYVKETIPHDLFSMVNIEKAKEKEKEMVEKKLRSQLQRCGHIDPNFAKKLKEEEIVHMKLQKHLQPKLQRCRNIDSNFAKKLKEEEIVYMKLENQLQPKLQRCRNIDSNFAKKLEKDKEVVQKKLKKSLHSQFQRAKHITHNIVHRLLHPQHSQLIDC